MAAKPSRTRADVEAENRVLRRYRQAEGVASILYNIVRWGGIVLVARYGYLSLDTLAGDRTTADIGIKLLADVRISQALAWLLAGSGTAYGLAQRKLRRDTVQRLQQRNEELELRLDPKRSSSRLTPRGETRPEDK